MSLSFVIENIYYLTGSLLFITSFWQLLLAQKAHKTLCTRQTSQLIKEFNDTISIIGNSFLEKIIKENLEDSSVEFNEHTELSDEVMNNYLIFIEKHSTELYTLLNFLEIYSTQINKKIVDIKTSFECNSLTFCEYVRCLSVPIYILRQKSNGFAYKNIVELYYNWKNKLEKNNELIK
ncbi:DUF4760 domain-containing protein [Bacteroides heparinolyticus]|uniref:DUF4760 domain-containing protein n=1 Tax=Prevotella heparinolytica TaxID=28113 RepID=UPI003FA09118